MNEKLIKKWLKPVRYKLHIERIINMLFKVIFLCGVIILLLSIIAHFIPIMYVKRWMLLIGGISGITAFIMIFILYPNITRTIKKADSLGFHERFITAWVLRKEDTSEAKLQREELKVHLQEKNIKKMYKMKYAYKPLSMGLVFLLIAIGLLYVKSPAKVTAERLEDLKSKLEEQADTLKAEKDKLYDEYKLPDDTKEELDKEFDELMKKMENSKTEEEALKNLAIAKNEMKQLDPETINNDLKKLGNTLGTKNLQDLAEAMKNQDLEDIKKQLEELMEKMEKGELTEEDAEVLKNTAEQLDNEELKEAIEKMADNISKQNSEGAKIDTQAINDLLEKQLSDNKAAGNMSSFSQGMQAAINQAGQQMSSSASISELAFSSTTSAQGAASTSNQASGSSSPGSQSDGQSGSQGQSDGQSQGNDGSQGQGDGQSGSQGQGDGQSGSQGQGQGQGSSQGPGSGGAGQGSTNEDSGYSEDSAGTSHNNNQGNGQGGEYEALYQPNRLGGSSESTFVKGSKSESGESSYEAVDSVPIENGDLVPYTEISGSYKNQASMSVDTLSIPAVMKDLIRDYFSSID